MADHTEREDQKLTKHQIMMLFEHETQQMLQMKKLIKENMYLESQIGDKDNRIKNLAEQMETLSKSLEARTSEALMNTSDVVVNGNNPASYEQISQMKMEMSSILEKSKQALSTAAEWILQIGHALRENGLMTDASNSKVLDEYQILYNSFDSMQPKECIMASAEISLPNPGRPTGASANPNEVPLFVPQFQSNRNITSPTNLQEHTRNSVVANARSSAYAKKLTPRYALNRLSPLPTSPQQLRRRRRSATMKFSSTPIRDRNNRSANPYLGPVPQIALHNEVDHQRVSLNFPLDPTLKEQSVQIFRFGDNVKIDYAFFPRESISRGSSNNHNSSVITDDEPVVTKVIEQNATFDLHNMSASSPNTVEIIEEGQKENELSNNSLVEPPQSVSNLDVTTTDVVMTDDILCLPNQGDEYILGYFNPGETQQQKNISDVIDALENLTAVQYNRNLADQLTETLQVALHRSVQNDMMDSAVMFTVNYLCACTVNPLVAKEEKGCTQNQNETKFLMPQEVCVINAYCALNVGEFICKLVKAMQKKVMSNDDDLQDNCQGLGALCRVFTYLKKSTNDMDSVKGFFFDLFKKHTMIAPYLASSVLSQWPDVLTQISENSGKYLSTTLNYMIHHNPGASEDLWNEFVLIYKRFSNKTGQMNMNPVSIVESIISSIVGNSCKGSYSDEEEFNYITSLELLNSRFSSDWIFKYVIDVILLLLKNFVLKQEDQQYAAVILVLKLLRILSIDYNSLQEVLKVVTYTKDEMLKYNVPMSIQKQLYKTQHVLHLKVFRTSNIEVESWLQQHGTVEDGTS